jgi:hypothetical protein
VTEMVPSRKVPGSVKAAGQESASNRDGERNVSSNRVGERGALKVMQTCSSPEVQVSRALSEEERRAVQGLLACEPASPTRNMAWSPAKCPSEWPTRRDGGYLGAGDASSPAREQRAMSIHGTIVPVLSRTATSNSSTSWMRESVVRDIMLLEHEEASRAAPIDDESTQHFATPISPTPEEVSLDDDSSTSTPATTPAHGRSPSLSDHAASPDCEAIPEDDCCAFGFTRKISSPLTKTGDGGEWAMRSVRAPLQESVENMPRFSSGVADGFPVYRFEAPGSEKSTTPMGPHMLPATAAAGSVRKVSQKGLAQRSHSASGQRSPEALMSRRQSPSPSTLAGEPDDMVIKFGSKKYTIGGRLGVAPWQDKGASHAQKTAHAAGDKPAPGGVQLASMLRQQQWRTNRVGNPKGCGVKTAGKGLNSNSVAATAAAATASRAAAPAKVVPSIPTASQCAEADIGGLGVGGRALVGRAKQVCGGGTAAGAGRWGRKEVKVQQFNANIGGLELAGKGGTCAPVKRGAWGIGNRGTAAAGGMGPTFSVSHAR